MGFIKFTTSEKIQVVEGEDKETLSSRLAKFAKSKVSDLTDEEKQELFEDKDGNN